MDHYFTHITIILVRKGVLNKKNYCLQVGIYFTGLIL